MSEVVASVPSVPPVLTLSEMTSGGSSSSTSMTEVTVSEKRLSSTADRNVEHPHEEETVVARKIRIVERDAEDTQEARAKIEALENRNAELETEAHRYVNREWESFRRTAAEYEQRARDVSQVEVAQAESRAQAQYQHTLELVEGPLR